MLYKEKDKPFKGGDILSRNLLKKVGLALIALLVVCNTYSIQGMKKHSNKNREAFSGMRARMGNVPQRQRPAMGQEHGQRSRAGANRSNWGKKKQQESETE